jgi:tetratricopeptide (TPR) repeat protein
MTSKFTTVLCAVALTLATAVKAQNTAPTSSGELRVSTRSKKARELLDRSWVLAIDQVEQQKAVMTLRGAVKADPRFALAHEILAQTSLDSAERVREQAHAFRTRRYASPGEQKLIEWLQNAADHKLIPAITDMNEVVRQYPHDRWVIYLANNWLIAQTQYERAAAVYENSGITDYPGLMNNMAYNYAYMRQFDKAFAQMDKYVASLPKEPNPQDSYAEILRMAGRFDDALVHYRAALDVDPEFYPSRFGIADTYSLMGDQARARQEYAAAFQKFRLPDLHEIQWKTREAITYVRDGHTQRANLAFQAIADYAHVKNISQAEADAYRQMALYQRTPQQAIMFLTAAETALNENGNVSANDFQQVLASILRVRVEAQLRAADFGAAESTLRRLEKLSNSADDLVIENAFNGAAGAFSFAKGDYKNAVAHLEEDSHDPRSLKLLSEAYKRNHEQTEAHRVSEIVLNLNDPTIEQAITVPEFRNCFEHSPCHANVKHAAFQK